MIDGVSKFFDLRWIHANEVRLTIRPDLIGAGGLLSGVATFALVDYCMGSTLWKQTSDSETKLLRAFRQWVRQQQEEGWPQKGKPSRRPPRKPMYTIGGKHDSGTQGCPARPLQPRLARGRSSK